MTSNFRRALAFVLTVIVLLGAWTTSFDVPARESLDAGMKRALIAFAAARTLGAVISVAQGTQVDIKPGGVGVGTTPGQVLQPLNQLVDHFATAMLAASVAFGVQLVLLDFGSSHAVAALLSIATVGWLVLTCLKGGRHARWLQPVLVLLLLARFAVPLTAVANEALYERYMKGKHDKALTLVERTPQEVASATLPVPSKETIRERFERWWNGLPDLKAGYQVLLDSASTWADRIVDLMVVFLVQTLIVPVGMLWLMWRAARLATASQGGSDRTAA
ncbi:hypothetical protein [Variovorax sp. LT1R16]|uniref:hypothetical protein n=1 Tax=Variovorax sp. LT1R16 TaxID=3443728 RepID=UPI003F4785A4